MNVLISGAGIAGLTLAFQLQHAGHRVTLVEQAPSLRGEGYMIDFFGAGYDAAERMGLLPDLEPMHYPIGRLSFLREDGTRRFAVPYPAIRRLFDDRHFNFMRGDLEQAIFSRLESSLVPRYETTVTGLRQDGPAVHATLSDGSAATYDLVVGADGIHSGVRALAFGPEASYARYLGHRTAAFVLPELPAGLKDPDAFATLTVPGRQVAVYPIRGGRAATFFVHRAPEPPADTSHPAALEELRAVYSRLDWIVPALLEAAGGVSIYYDAVSQVVMPSWRSGRIVLLGDACQCVSLLAGQGSSMAVYGAWVLAGELARAGDVEHALGRYEARMRPAILKRQEAGRRMARWFVPDTRPRIFLRDLMMRMANWPLANRVLAHALASDSELRD
ncbi:MAG: FAD-dependent monooxygenase [Gemmatimonadales bacterium]